MKLLDRHVCKKPANGILYLTATHLTYVEASGAAQKETWVCLQEEISKGLKELCLHANMVVS